MRQKNYIILIRIKIDAAVERVSSIRDRLGYDIEIGIDFHGEYTKQWLKF